MYFQNTGIVTMHYIIYIYIYIYIYIVVAFVYLTVNRMSKKRSDVIPR